MSWIAGGAVDLPADRYSWPGSRDEEWRCSAPRPEPRRLSCVAQYSWRRAVCLLQPRWVCFICSVPLKQQDSFIALFFILFLPKFCRTTYRCECWIVGDLVRHDSGCLFNKQEKMRKIVMNQFRAGTPRMLSRGQTGELLDRFGQQVALANVSSLHARWGLRQQQ